MKTIIGKMENSTYEIVNEVVKMIVKLEKGKLKVLKENQQHLLYLVSIPLKNIEWSIGDMAMVIKSLSEKFDNIANYDISNFKKCNKKLMFSISFDIENDTHIVDTSTHISISEIAESIILESNIPRYEKVKLRFNDIVFIRHMERIIHTVSGLYNSKLIAILPNLKRRDDIEYQDVELLVSVKDDYNDLVTFIRSMFSYASGTTVDVKYSNAPDITHDLITVTISQSILCGNNIDNITSNIVNKASKDCITLPEFMVLLENKLYNKSSKNKVMYDGNVSVMTDVDVVASALHDITNTYRWEDNIIDKGDTVQLNLDKLTLKVISSHIK